ncbi:hypothetical protein VTN02DRAFT_1277 [Thermoascus thermophilus]
MASSGALNTSSFPIFNDGDVRLIIPPDNIYQLHSTVLKRSSGFFAGALTESNAAKLHSKAKKFGVTVRFQLHLVYSPANPNGVFEMMRLDGFGRSSGTNIGMSGVIESRVHEMAYKNWYNLLGAFYNRTPEINDTDMSSLVTSCMGLVEVAESIDAVGVIRESVDIALLRQGQVLFRSIAANPSPWADLAIRIHSPTIFRESVIHLVGKWNQMTDPERKMLSPGIRELCERKWAEMQLQKQAIEIRILGYYPDMLRRRATDNIHRASYANDVYMWMALAFYRQWFSQAMSEGRHHIAPDGGAAFYRAIGAAGAAYLDIRAQASFQLHFPMSQKGTRIIQHHINTLKHDVREFVADLLVHNSQIQITEGEELAHLTCCVVKTEDLPWGVPVDPQAESATEDVTDNDAEYEPEDYAVPDDFVHVGAPGPEEAGDEEGYGDDFKHDPLQSAEALEDIGDLLEGETVKAFL